MSYAKALETIRNHSGGLVAYTYVMPTADGPCFCALTVACPNIRKFMKENNEYDEIESMRIAGLVLTYDNENYLLADSGLTFDEAMSLQFRNDHTPAKTPEERKKKVIQWLEQKIAGRPTEKLY